MHVFSSEIIGKIADPKQWISSMEDALLAERKDEFHTPKRMHVDMAANTLLLMPSVGIDYFATKLVSVFPENKSLNKAVIQGSLLLNNAKTGEPLAIMNAAKLTAMRTAAVATVGVRYLCSNAKSVGIIGAGFQGRHLAWFAASETNCKTIYVYDNYPDSIKGFAEFVNLHCRNLEIVVCENIAKVFKNSEIIITATSSERPVIPDDVELLKGKKIIGVGSFKPNMREFSDSLFGLLNNVWIDAEHAKTESGDLVFPLRDKLIKDSQIKNVSDLIGYKIKLDTKSTQLYKTVGHGIFDLFAAKIVFENAKELDLGEEFEI